MSARREDGFAADEQFERYVREEAAAAERFTARARLITTPSLLALALLTAPFSDTVRSALPALFAFAAVGAVYALGTELVLRRRYQPAVGYVTSAIDALLVTIFVLVASGTTGDTAVSTKTTLNLMFFVVIVIAGLRLSVILPIFAAAASAIAYLAQLLPVWLLEPQRLTADILDFDVPSVSVVRSVVVAAFMIISGLLVSLTAQRSRRLVRRGLHTLTFLFADLRDYTAFVETRGDAAAAALIGEYRRLVRTHVARTEGAEIKTEGDSFFVTFPTAREALRCAMAILQEAERRSQERPELPIRVGVGLHAGEPVPQEGGFVGSAVNVAARLAQQAGAGELLVSEVVRGLLRTSGLPAMRERQGLVLKGVVDAPRVYSVDWQVAVAERASAEAGGR